MCPNAWFTGKRRARTRWLRILCLLIAICTMFPIRTYAVTLQDLYHFNSTFGDSLTAELDDGGSGQINITVSFPFFNKKHDKLYVNNNGVISFLKELKVYRPDDFPLQDATPIIAPFWADVDVTEGGHVWYREETNPQTLNIATKEVQRYYPKARKFKATWMFVATWDRVCFYGASGAGENKTNTFQAVLITNGKESFVIFNYQRIDWTTGSNSGGDTTTGLGGNPAQAGFNAGDKKTYYEIDGARKDTVINLTLTSNVNIPGKWFFKVDSAQIQGRCSNAGRPQSHMWSFRERIYKRSVTPSSKCDNSTTDSEGSGSVNLSPSSGYMLGGNVVNVTDPCFTMNDTVIARIDNTNQTFECFVVDSTIASCRFPPIFRTGKLDFSLNINYTGWNFTGSYLVENLIFDVPALKRENANEWKFGQGDNVKITISTSSVRKLGATSNVPSILTLFSYEDGRLQEVEREELNLSDPTYDKFLPNTINGALAVLRISPRDDSNYLDSIWSDVFPVRNIDENFSEKQCNKWLERESKSTIDMEPCPCTFGQAEGDTGRYQPYPLCHQQSSISTCIYNQEARNCILPNYQGSQTNSQICCYDKDGELLNALSNTGGGTSIRYHYLSQGDNIVPYFTFLEQDLLPSLHCCQFTSNDTLCKHYHSLRNSTTCQGYDPPAAAQAAGDPHIVSFDGKAYTFNGVGEFILVEDKNKTVIVQVQTQQAKDIDGKLQKATIFNAVAIQVTNVSDKIEIKWFEDQPVQVLVNGQGSQLSATSHQLNGLTVYMNKTDSNTTEFTVVMDSVGMSVLVVATPDLLNIMIMVGSSSLKGNLEGLLGDYNEDMSNDFVSRDGYQLPETATMSEIHYRFGMTWNVSGNESLFTKEEENIVNNVNSVQSVNNNTFEPDFIDAVGKNVSNNVRDLCGDNLPCIYDFTQTRKPSVALTTKSFEERFKERVKDTQRVVRCPYVDEIPNGNRTVTGFKVGSTVTFICNGGYVISPPGAPDTIVCQKEETWSRPIPVCVKPVPTEDEILWHNYVYIAVGVAGGFFVLVVIVFLVIRQACKKHTYRKPIEENDSEVIVELPEIFTPSPNIPEPVFKNPSFLESLEKLSSGTDRFRIPRPDYVDPNIYSEYF